VRESNDSIFKDDSIENQSNQSSKIESFDYKERGTNILFPKIPFRMLRLKADRPGIGRRARF